MVLNSFLCNRSWFLDLTLQSKEMSIALNYDVRRYGLSYEFYLCKRLSRRLQARSEKRFNT